MPPRSRLRRALLRRNALSGWGAWVRGDLDLCVVRFAPDYHYDAPPEWLIAGMPSVYRGHKGLREWSTELREAWEFVDHTPLEIVDAGDVIAFLCRIRLRARTSGIELDSRLGQVFWIERGLIARERDFTDRVLTALRVLGVETPNRSGLPIIEVPLRDHRRIDTVGRFLFERGVYVTLAAYPLVPKHEVGFRIQLTAANTDEQVESLIHAVEALADAGELRSRSEPIEEAA